MEEIDSASSSTAAAFSLDFSLEPSWGGAGSGGMGVRFGVGALAGDADVGMFGEADSGLEKPGVVSGAELGGAESGWVVSVLSTSGTVRILCSDLSSSGSF